MTDSPEITRQGDFLQKPPYHAADPAAFDKKLQGSCHCGRVKYWLSKAEPLNAKFCHCRGCQVMHGAPFQWAAIFHKEDMMFEKGAEDLVFYHSETRHLDHELPCKASCSYCRTPVMDEGRNMVLLFPTLIKFAGQKERDLFSPKCHIFYSQRVVDIPDGKPKWAGLDGEGKSTLLDDLE
ncbi:Mss4-like protein [Apiospora sp. TS-2023a]